MRVLAGDIGGTKTAVALVDIEEARLHVLREERYPSGDFASLEAILERVLGSEDPPRRAGFGVAGPVRAGRAKITKLPWIVDERKLSRRLDGAAVCVVNDFVAAARGIPYLTRPRLRTLARGKPERAGPLALIGAGTGLGEAALLPVGSRYEPVAAEGAHADFGPRDPLEDRLNAFVRARFGRTTYDRLLSGEGIGLMYDFLKSEGAPAESPEVRRRLAANTDRAAVVTRCALEERDPLCAETLRLFVSIYGSEAGNVALRYRATGGVFVGGGIAPKILPALEDGEFVRAFRSKPPMEALLAAVPVKVVLEPRLGLFGAAAAAYRMEIETSRPSAKSRTRRASR